MLPRHQTGRSGRHYLLVPLQRPCHPQTLRHRPVQPGSLRGSGQPAGNDQAKGRLWVSVGMGQSGCGSE